MGSRVMCPTGLGDIEDCATLGREEDVARRSKAGQCCATYLLSMLQNAACVALVWKCVYARLIHDLVEIKRKILKLRHRNSNPVHDCLAL